MAAPLLPLVLLLPLLCLASSAATDDLAALLALRSSVTLDPGSLLSRWVASSGGSHCRWRGVTCDASTGRVVGVDLGGGGLSGTLPGELSLLSDLRRLDLSGNNFSGSIPGELLASPTLESLDLSYNQLSGPIKVPPLANSSSCCHSLTHLRLAANLLIGGIPPEIGQCYSLRVVDVSRNILEGSIPPQLGRLTSLRVLDVSRNSLTDRIPRELGNCRELSVLVLTNLSGLPSELGGGQEFNAFIGGIPPEVLAIPSLEILWAPRANLDGRLPRNRNSSCSLRVVNLAQNYIAGGVPWWLGMCQNLTFLDLSSNKLEGFVPPALGFGCMVYFNVSRNSLSGLIVQSQESNCSSNPILGGNKGLLPQEDGILMQHYECLLQKPQKDNPFAPIFRDNSVVLHDFSWNGFGGALPSFSLHLDGNFSYGLVLNNNAFNGSLSGDFFRFCQGCSGFAVNLSSNHITGSLGALSNCSALESFEAAYNQFSGLIFPGISHLHLLRNLVLKGNNLSGEIPDQFGNLAALEVLDLSRNSLAGRIPSTLANASYLQVLLLDHNRLSGSVPRNFTALAELTMLDVSFNNLSGDIPYLRRSSNCSFFMGNPFLHPCVGPNASAPSAINSLGAVDKWQTTRFSSVMMALVPSACAVVSFLLVLLLFFVCKRRKRAKIAGLRMKVVVTFTDAPAELTYDNVVRATNNFIIQNLIGAGGFGATYKAELAPGYLVAVKRLAMGRFQGLQQFDAEIRTLGRIRHRNLVTLIGYHMGESDTFLIYNYLSGGNLETFIHDMGSRKFFWSEIHKIVQDVAQALAYLHYSCTPRIIHRDIKPSNILLDEKLNAYLSDFGLARLIEVSETHATTDVAGTFGYVAPEYATTCRVSDKADVYSFGVVLLELMSGKRSLDPSFSQYGDGFTIVAWGRMLMQENHSSEFFFPGLWEAGPKDKLDEMLRLALSCTAESLAIRPSMRQVVAKLKQLRSE